MLSFTWLWENIFNKIQLCFLNDVVLACGWVKPQKFLLIKYLERDRILLTGLCHYQKRKMSTHYPDLPPCYRYSLVIESVNYSKCQQANSNLGAICSNKVSTLTLSKRFSVLPELMIFFSFFLLLDVCVWFPELRDELIIFSGSGQKKKMKRKTIL